MAWMPDYITVDDLRAYVKVSDMADDVQMASAVTAASRAVDEACNRQFGVVDAPETRHYPLLANYTTSRWTAEIDDVQDVTGLAVEVDGETLTGWSLSPRNAAQTGRVVERIALASGAYPGEDEEVAVTALWGWTAVPQAVKQATLLQASRFLSRRDSPYGIAGSPTQGSELRLLSRLDPDVAVSLKAFRRMRLAA